MDVACCMILYAFLPVVPFPRTSRHTETMLGEDGAFKRPKNAASYIEQGDLSYVIWTLPGKSNNEYPVYSEIFSFFLFSLVFIGGIYK